ncbi:MAG: alpha-amylase family protein [Gemmatimonadetes bacterium]|nr:alpha-amylase family protein [Gemmatimonadota bacterium]
MLSLALGLAGCSSSSAGPSSPSNNGGTTVPVGRPVLPQTYRATGHAAAGDVFVFLFEWSWLDVATECERVLAPAGYKAAYVSPPQEHMVQPGGPWSNRYAPVSYSIAKSQSGTRDDFVAMVSRCHAVGVDIYADAVINHMTGGSGTGSNGTVYTKYHYPPLYDTTDFHPPCLVTDYTNAANVQDCELFGLADLNTGSASVQQKIADYLVSLATIGVAGFRVDAAKHIQPVELDGIVKRVDEAVTAAGKPAPYFFLEISGAPNEAVQPTDYFGLGYSSGGAADITEFNFRAVGDRFLNNGGRVASLSSFSQRTWGLLPADKAVVFLENHDTQRSGGISYRDGDTYRLANVFMLAQPYGYPVVMSSYAFDLTSQIGRDAGPPPFANGAGVPCAAPMQSAVVGQWVCEHRDAWITRTIAFRKAVAGTDMNTMWDNGSDAVAFSRGTQGFVAINNGTASLTASIPSSLPSGAYCDLLTGGRGATGCVGRTVTVSTDRTVPLTLDAKSAVLLSTGQRP